MQAVTFQLTAADLADGRLHVHNNTPAVRVVRLALVAFALACALGVVYAAYRGDWNRLTFFAAWLLGALAVMVWGYAANRWLLPPSARRQLARDKGLQGDRVVSWDGDGVSFKGGHTQSRWPWGDLNGWDESPGGFIFWQSDRIYSYLPKRSLTGDQIAEVRATLTSAVGKPGRRLVPPS